MRILRAAILLCLLLWLGPSCAYKTPESHDRVLGRYTSSEKQRVWDAVLQVLEQKQIPVATRSFGEGTIVSDSISFTPEQIDCGKNFFGADYIGTRKGVLRIMIRQKSGVEIEFRLKSILTIAANNKQVECNSFGALEREILDAVDLQLGLKRDQANEGGNE